VAARLLNLSPINGRYYDLSLKRGSPPMAFSCPGSSSWGLRVGVSPGGLQVVIAKPPWNVQPRSSVFPVQRTGPDLATVDIEIQSHLPGGLVSVRSSIGQRCCLCHGLAIRCRNRARGGLAEQEPQSLPDRAGRMYLCIKMNPTALCVFGS
jgi:hypothetical protein